MFKSVINNAVYFHLITTGDDIYSDEIVEISAIKFKEEREYEVFHYFLKPRGKEKLHFNDDFKEKVNNGLNIWGIKEDFINFIEDLPLIYHGENMDKFFIINNFGKLTNPFLNSKELAAILEPYRSSFELLELVEEISSFQSREVYGKKGVIDTLNLVNSLLIRHFTREETLKKDTLYEVLVKYYGLKEGWHWTKYLLKPIFLNYEDYKEVILKENIEKVINSTEINYNLFEELLRDNKIWDADGDFGYEYREDQEKLARKIRENFEKGERIFIEAPTGSGKTFAYVLIAAIETYINKINKRHEDASFIISTDTKELQNQLINKDIPNILKKLNLLNKISFGAMKGKNNYLCFERLKEYDDFYGLEGKLSRLFLSRLGQNGEYGEASTINYWAYKHFNLDNYWEYVCCDSEKCNLEKCYRPCFLRKRYNELPTENITVVNHSLLASWPYGEKKKITHLILDESHNLMEKAYDFYSEEFLTKDFVELIDTIENGHPSIYMLLNKLNGEHGYRETISLKDLKYWVEEIKSKIYMLLGSIREMNLKNPGYNFVTEYTLPRKEYKESIKSLTPTISGLKEDIYNLYRLLNNYISNIMLDDEINGDKDYKTLMEFTLKIKEAFDVIDKFLEETTYYAKIFEVDIEYRGFLIKNTPLLVGELINENLLKGVKSTTFLSATLKIDNSFRMMKNHLGQQRAKEYNVPPVFKLREKTKIFVLREEERYSFNEFVPKNSKFIMDLAKILQGHMLILFNNNKRRDEFYTRLSELSKDEGIEVYRDKRNLHLLKDETRKVIILGSKGFFEGIDIPGDALSCVIIDKIPNKTPEDPILKAITTHQNKRYHEVNYPQLCIKMKQIYGRLIRSKVDYGYFIILDGGENKLTISNIERDLKGPKISYRSREDVLKMAKDDFSTWKNNNLKFLINEEEKNKKSNFNNISKKYKLFWKIKKGKYYWKE